jgi:hypothetical protein
LIYKGTDALAESVQGDRANARCIKAAFFAVDLEHGK